MRKILTGLVFCLLAPFTFAGHHEKGEMSANVMAAKAGYDALTQATLRLEKHKLMTLFLNSRGFAIQRHLRGTASCNR